MKIITRILLTLIVSLLFYPVFSAEKIELSFSWWGTPPRDSLTKKAISLFEERNPGVSIKTTSLPFVGYLDWLKKEYDAGKEPDVMQINWAWISTVFSPNGDGLYDLFTLKEYINPDEFGELLLTGIVNGKLNGVPVSTEGIVYLYQKNTFDKAGLKIPATWDDLFAASPVFSSKIGKDSLPMYSNEDKVHQAITSYLLQTAGEQWIDPQNNRVMMSRKTANDLVSFLRKACKINLFSHEIYVNDPSLTKSAEWRNGMIAGKSSWISDINRVAPLTDQSQLILGEQVTVANPKKNGIYARPNMMLSVSRHSKHPDISAKFISFLLCDPDAVKILGESRGVPITKTGSKIFSETQTVIPLIDKAHKYFAKNGYEALNPYIEHPKIIDHALAVLRGIESGKLTDDQAADMLVDGTNTILAQIVHPDFHAPSSLKKSGYSYTEPVGLIYDAKVKEVIVAGRVAGRINIGDTIVVDTGSSPVFLTAVFPMMSMVKCSVKSGKLSDLKPGMRVYLKVEQNK